MLSYPRPCRPPALPSCCCRKRLAGMAERACTLCTCNTCQTGQPGSESALNGTSDIPQSLLLSDEHSLSSMQLPAEAQRPTKTSMQELCMQAKPTPLAYIPRVVYRTTQITAGHLSAPVLLGSASQPVALLLQKWGCLVGHRVLALLHGSCHHMALGMDSLAAPAVAAQDQEPRSQLHTRTCSRH